MVDLKEWIKGRTEEDERLYNFYGKPLEEKHKGEFVAIGPNGETIVGTNRWEVAQRALDRFGSGNYAFRRVGFKAALKWRATADKR